MGVREYLVAAMVAVMVALAVPSAAQNGPIWPNEWSAAWVYVNDSLTHTVPFPLLNFGNFYYKARNSSFAVAIQSNVYMDGKSASSVLFADDGNSYLLYPKPDVFHPGCCMLMAGLKASPPNWLVNAVNQGPVNLNGLPLTRWFNKYNGGDYYYDIAMPDGLRVPYALDGGGTGMAFLNVVEMGQPDVMFHVPQGCAASCPKEIGVNLEHLVF
jgi:hypothetical protein